MSQLTTHNEQIELAVSILQKAKYGVAFTGAGISVESGIPQFRGKDGIWSKYDPIYLEIGFFHKKPLVSWQKIKEIFYDTLVNAEPNFSHYFLAKLEKRGIIEAIITQNIDNLHQLAGSKKIYELHGTTKTLQCIECSSEYDLSFIDLNFLPPTCYICKGILKPAIVFFNEQPPEKILKKSFEEASKADVLIVIGTDGEVLPASRIPYAAKENGATIIEINIKETGYTKEITDIFIKGKAAEITQEMGKLLLM